MVFFWLGLEQWVDYSGCCIRTQRERKDTSFLVVGLKFGWKRKKIVLVLVDAPKQTNKQPPHTLLTPSDTETKLVTYYKVYLFMTNDINKSKKTCKEIYYYYKRQEIAITFLFNDLLIILFVAPFIQALFLQHCTVVIFLLPIQHLKQLNKIKNVF